MGKTSQPKTQSKSKAQKAPSSEAEAADLGSIMTQDEWNWIPTLPNLVYILVIFAVATATSYNSVHNDFVFDDDRGVVNNPDLRPENSIFGLLYHDFWGTPMSEFRSHKSYRPLTVLTFRWNYAISKLDPSAFHLVNVLLNAVVSVILFVVASKFIDRRAAFVSTMLFSVHSIHTEAVANIVGRAEMLSAIFFLASILSYMRAVSPRDSTSWSFGWLVLAVIMGILALISKEQGIICLLVCAGYDAVVVNGFGPLQAIKGLGSHAAYRTRIVFLALSSIILLYFRVRMNQGGDIQLNPNEHLVAFHPSKIVQYLSLTYYAAVSTWLLLFPQHLCSDWSHGTIPLLEGADVRVLILVFFVAVMAALAWRAFISTSKRSDDGCLKMGLLIAILGYLPSSGFFFRVGFVIAERVLYLPSIGYCLILVWGLARVPKAVRILVVCVLLGFMSAKTVQRNSEWQTNFTIHEAGAATCSNNVKLLANYGLELHSLYKQMVQDNTGTQAERAKHLKAAEAQYLKALAIDPYYVAACFNYGNLLQDQNRIEDAVKVYAKSLERIDPSRATIGLMNNLASAYYYLNRFDDSEKTFLQLLQLDSEHFSAINGLASLYGASGKYDLSEKYFKQLIEKQPDYAEARFNYGTLLITVKRYDEAEVQLKKALQINPNHDKAINNMKVIEYERKQLNKSV